MKIKVVLSKEILALRTDLSIFAAALESVVEPKL